MLMDTIEECYLNIWALFWALFFFISLKIIKPFFQTNVHLITVGVHSIIDLQYTILRFMHKFIIFYFKFVSF